MKKSLLLITSLLAAGTLGAWADTTITDLSTSTTNGNVTYTAPASGSTTGTISGTSSSDISEQQERNSRYLVTTTVNLDVAALTSNTQILNYTDSNGGSSGAIGLYYSSSDSKLALTWGG